MPSGPSNSNKGKGVDHGGAGLSSSIPVSSPSSSSTPTTMPIDEIRAQYQELGVSPRVPNIPTRSPVQHASSGAPTPSPHKEPDQLELPPSAAPPANIERGSSANISMASDADSSLFDVDNLPMTDAQKARIVSRHLAVAPGADETSSASNRTSLHDDSTDGGKSAPGEAPPRVHFPAAADAEASASDVEGYQGPHSMQGGAITDDIYRWAYSNRPQTNRRTRSESLHLPRTSTIDPDLDTSGIKEPGGFRRYFVQTRADAQGRPPPRALRSFIDFLSLYGHFAGEALDEEDDEEEEEEEGEETEDEERAIAGTSRDAGRGTTEQSSLLTQRGRRSQRRGLNRSNTEQRIRNASANRKQGEATVTEAVLMLLKSFVGTGILFLGKAFSNGGLLFSVVVLVAVALISLGSFLLLVKIYLKVPASFGEMGGVLYGPYMRYAILASIVFSQLGFVAAYTVFVAQNMQAFILAVSHCKHLVPIVWLILGQLIAFIPLSLVRRIAKLSSTALIADVFILFGIIYLFQYEIRMLADRGLADVKQFNKHDFPLLIGTAVFTFEGIGLVIPITESMKEPKKFPGVLSGVMVGVMILFAMSGALSYGAFGSKTQTVVITNLPQDSKFVQAMQFLYSIAILLSTPLQLFPALSILERGIFTTKSGKYDWRVKAQKNLFRCLVVVACAMAAWAGASDLDKFVSLIGSIACVPLCFIYPPLLHLKACATKTRTKVLDYLLLLFGIVCVGFAGSQTIIAMAQPSPPSEIQCTPPPGF